MGLSYRKVAVFALLITGIVATAPDAYAWGPQGHHVVGGYADNHLSPEAKGIVGHLLAGERDPTLAGVSTWADDIRNDGSELAHESAPWHYADIGGYNCHYTPEAGRGANVVEALHTQTGILADRTQSDENRAQALKFVVHFVGDAHQPFHAGYESDRGGNDHHVTYNGTHTNMHSVWDSRLIGTLRLSDTAFIQRLESLPEDTLPEPDIEQDPITWIEESCQIAIHAYPDSATIGSAYTEHYLPIAEQRLHLAGERLTQLLNTLLAE